jgi:hypothetical protein
MLKKNVTACLLGTALIAVPAYAQQQPRPQPPAQQPQPQAQQPQVQQQQAGQFQYITQNRSGLWRASKLNGVDVYNEQNEKIGDITEVLVDQQGQAEAVVIGVGGFLGIGQRDVAVPFNALRWQLDDRDTTVGATTRGTTTAPPPAAQRDTATAPPAQRPAPAPRSDAAAPAPRDTTAQAPAARDTRAAEPRSAEVRDAPRRAILPGATKDQLRNAPEFKYGRS